MPADNLQIVPFRPHVYCCRFKFFDSYERFKFLDSGLDAGHVCGLSISVNIVISVGSGIHHQYQSVATQLHWKGNLKATPFCSCSVPVRRMRSRHSVFQMDRDAASGLVALSVYFTRRFTISFSS